MNLLKPSTWFKKGHGSWVKVRLDYDFVEVHPAKADSKLPFSIDLTRTACLYIPDLEPEEAKAKLLGRRFDWHRIHSHWRHFLELQGFHKAVWVDVEKYLKDEV